MDWMLFSIKNQHSMMSPQIVTFSGKVVLTTLQMYNFKTLGIGI